MLTTHLDSLDAPALRALLQSGGAQSVNTKLDDGRLPLHHAIENGSAADSAAALEIVRCLLDFDADPTSLDEDGQGTALHVVAGSLAREPGFALPCLRLLLDWMPTPLDLDTLLDAEGNTPMAVAVQQGKQLGAGDPATQQAAEDAVVSGVKTLLSHGSGLLQYAPAAKRGKKSQKDERRPISSLLHVAAEWTPTRCVEALLQGAEAGAAMETADESGDGPLQRALAAGRSATAQQLLLKFPEALIRPGDLPGRASSLFELVRSSATHPARHLRSCNYPGCAQLLVEVGGRSVDEKDEDGRTALALAAETGVSMPLVRELLRLRARVDALDSRRREPAMLAAARGHTEVLQLLLSRSAEAGDGARAARGADVDGLTALMHAAARRNAGCVRLLLDHGANPQALDGDGRSALLHALRGLPAVPAAAATTDADALGVVGSLLRPPVPTLPTGGDDSDEATAAAAAAAAAVLAVVADRHGTCALALAAWKVFTTFRYASAPSIPAAA